MANKQTRQKGPVKPTLGHKSPAANAPAAKPVMVGPELIRRLFIYLVAISAFVYINTLQNGFVLDDVMVITKNSYVKEGIKAIPKLLVTPRLMGHNSALTDTYRPLSLVMFATEYQLFGANPVIGHAMNVIIFVLCVLVLFLFLVKLLGDQRIVLAFMVAALFAVHPLHTEVVANIKSRDELLCFLFAFLSLNLFLDYARSGALPKLLLGIFCYFLACISKETAVTFIAVVPLIFFFYKNENKVRSALITVGALLVAGAFIFIRYIIVNKYAAGGLYEVVFLDNMLVGAPSASSRVATAILILGTYLKLLVVPYPLIFDYSYSSIPYVGFDDIGVLLSLAIYLALGIISILRLLKNKSDVLAFGILFYLITISMFSNIFFLVGSTQADRFTFFASVGICLLIGLGIEKWWVKTTDVAALSSQSSMGVLIAICVVFGMMTISRNTDWKNNYSLYLTDSKKSPLNTRLFYYLGTEVEAQSNQERDPEKQMQIHRVSLAYLERAIKIYPDNLNAHAEAGAIYVTLKKYDSAFLHLDKALRLDPKQSTAAFNMGALYLGQSKFAEALPYYRKCFERRPENTLALFNIAVCLAQIKQYDSSITYLKQLAVKQPDLLNYKVFESLAIVYSTMGNADSANHYIAVARLHNPKFGQ